MTPEVATAFFAWPEFCLGAGLALIICTAIWALGSRANPADAAPATPPGLFDMTACKPGDLLVTKNGAICEYVGRTTFPTYPHRVKYIRVEGNWILDKDFPEGTRTDYGCVTDGDSFDGLDIADKLSPAATKILLAKAVREHRKIAAKAAAKKENATHPQKKDTTK
jgi:hypothetical protein